jgi:outer membrane protein assembly factor BamA
MRLHLKKNAHSLIISAFLMVVSFQVLHAQRDSTTLRFLKVEHIHIEGNKKTRQATILREMEFITGDAIPEAGLTATLERNRLRIMNLGIFSNTEISVVAQTDSTLRLKIAVTEGWYILPVPLLSLADRNFNVWWDEFNRSFKRVNYGLDWTQLNLTGRADALKAKAQFGYTNRYEIQYRSPSLNRARTLGFETSISYSRAHEVAFNTFDNKLQFLKIPEEWLIEQWYVAGTFSSRPKYFTTQSLTLEYRDTRISDTIATFLNPDYFLNNERRQKHSSAIYGITIDHRDIRPYPLSGWRAIGELRWNGLLPGDDLHVGRIFAQFDQYFPLAKWLSLETIVKGRFSYPRRQLPWSNNQGLGYGGNFVRGFEYYVVDGLDFGVLRTSWHFRLLSKKFNLGRFMPAKAYRKLPLAIYLALNTDVGFANDPYYSATNPLANRALLGYGPGIDVVAWYDKTIRMEWSWNDLGESGFFLRINAGF